MDVCVYVMQLLLLQVVFDILLLHMISVRPVAAIFYTSFVVTADVCTDVQNLDMDDFQPVELLNAYLEAMGRDSIRLPDVDLRHRQHFDVDHLLPVNSNQQQTGWANTCQQLATNGKMASNMAENWQHATLDDFESVFGGKEKMVRVVLQFQLVYALLCEWAVGYCMWFKI